MTWTANQLRWEIKKLKAGWEQREQTLLTTNPQAQSYLDLEQDFKKIKQEAQEIINFFQNECDFKDLTNARKQLNGLTVPELLQTIIDWEERYKELEELNNQQATETKQNIQELKKEKRALEAYIIREKKRIKDQANKDISHLKTQNNKLIQDFNQVQQENTTLHHQFQGYLKKYKVKDFVELDKLITGKDKDLDDLIAATNKILQKHGTTSLSGLSKKLTDTEKNKTKLEQDKNKLQQDKTQLEQAQIQGKKVFGELVEVIKPKSVIFLGKKKVKSKLSSLKQIFHWDQVNTEEISEDEQ